MRASTVFIIALALLAGVATAAGARYAGLFNKKEPPPPPPAPPPLKVLVTRINLYEDIAVTIDQVMVQDIPFEEQESLAKQLGPNWRDKLMPPQPRAAHLRIVKQTLHAGQILLKEHFNDPTLPDPVTMRLEPNTRAVNVVVPKDRAGGGLMRVGEYVDVLLTTDVSAYGRDETKTACIARGCKVVMKRNNPWTVLVADPDDKPLHFTLQANAYRAALIEYAQTHGQVSLQPVQVPARSGGSFSDPTSKEYATEDQRIDAINRGEVAIGDRDLARIFQITPPELKETTPRTPPLVTRHISGVRYVGQTVFRQTSADASPESTVGGTTPTNDAGTAPSLAGSSSVPENLSFRLPSATGKDCKDCDEKRKAANRAKGN